MPRELGIRKGELWAYRQGKNTPLVPARVVHQPPHYEATIMIRPVGDHTNLAIGVRRVKLPCKWEDVDAYLAAHPDIPRSWPERKRVVDDPIADAAELFSIGEAAIRRIVREELERAISVPRVSLTYVDAAKSTGYSVSALKVAVSRGALIPSYANSKPVFTIEELHRWVDSLPDEPV